ncbi:MAG: TIGR00341 family protein [Xanthomonadales bacterium]
MKYIEIIADAGSFDTIRAIAEQTEAVDVRTAPADEEGDRWMRLLVRDDKLQGALDALQNTLGSQSDARISVLSVELSLPRQQEHEEKEEDKAVAAREALHGEVAKGARLNANYLVLVVLSTLVAAIGLLADNVAVVVGAMVIAPLLGPNLAFALGTALGDTRLMREAALSLLLGLALAIALSAALGLVWPYEAQSAELAMRTQVGIDSVALALASGAAAALSLTSGLSSVLVGVMVAVALLPPAATLGLMLGHGDTTGATGAGLLLAINIVCVNLSCKVVFLFKRIRPRVWWEKEKARRGMRNSVIAWVVSLGLLIGMIYLRQLLAA